MASPHALIDQLIDTSFAKYDRDKDGFLSREEVRQLLTDAFINDVSAPLGSSESTNKANEIVVDFIENLTAGKSDRLTKEALSIAIKPLIIEIFEND
jgi:Ca2+-binding EF-hand superfamily protein